MAFVMLLIVGLVTGSLITLQSVINASLGRYVGSIGAVFIVGMVSAVLIAIIILLFPASATLRRLPGPHQWYLYLGGVLGMFIVAVPVFLVPRIGATATVTSIVCGQLAMAVIADELGLLGTPRIQLSAVRIAGVVLLAIGAYLVARN